MKEDKKRELTDRKWVKKCLDGDLTAFDELVRRYERPVFNLVFRITGDQGEAKDMTQEVFLRAFRFLKDYNPQYKFSNWLFKIAANLSINSVKRQKKHISFNEGHLLNLREKSPSPENIMESNELKEFIQKAILSLPVKYRALILLRHQHDLTYEEISFATGFPIGTVKTYLFRAREILKNRLRKVINNFYES